MGIAAIVPILALGVHRIEASSVNFVGSVGSHPMVFAGCADGANIDARTAGGREWANHSTTGW